MKRILVAAALIRRGNRLLIARRPDDKHQGGLWEFPGGKVEAGESVEQALTRELSEELGIEVHGSRPLIRIHHDYPDKSVCLDVRVVEDFSGEPEGREGQPLRWVTSAELRDFDFPAANHAIVTAARLPQCYFISPPCDDQAAVLSWLESRLAIGAGLVLLRQPDWSRQAYIAVAQRCLARCQQTGASLILHGLPDLLEEVPAHGLHLPSRHLGAFLQRPIASTSWLSASVHNLDEIRAAERLQADFLVLSPVKPTLSHPQASVLGWQGFADRVERARLPVYALGGMTHDDIELAIQHGAQGVAGMRGI